MEEIREGTRGLSAKHFYLAILCSLPIFVLFAALGRVDQAFGAASCCAVVMLAAMSRWDLKRRLWFWVAMGVIVLAQVPIVVLVPWGAKGINGRAVYPIAIADGSFAYGCLKLAGYLIKARDRRHSLPSKAEN